ncbi:MAG: diaminopimelate epimerase [Candidatus Paracaedibacteraceae bacterium]|nr:diaminopimelate epimerase [Candidatus Paracaedibacteraceae bacterium]
MMTQPLKFTKAQALGNDFVILEGQPQPIGVIQKLAHRRLGVGCDQVIFYQKIFERNVNIQFYNADGSVAGACGNGSRALAKLLCSDGKIILKTQDRDLHCVVQKEIITIDMGVCRIDASHGHGSLDSSFWILADVGNPHRIAFVDRLDAYDLEAVAKPYPHENVSLAQMTDTGVRLMTWERGSGYTGACGTAACAVAAAAIHFGQESAVLVSQSGGDLTITVSDGRVYMSGTAEIVFVGEFYN